MIEPSLIEIKDLDVKIQAEMRRLKLRDILVDEIKRSRSYAAKVQVALNKALELKKKETKKDNVAGLWGSLGTQRDLGRPAQINLSPGFLFSNFPGSDLLGDVARENYSRHDYGEGSHTGQQRFFGQPEIFGQAESLDQFGISGQPGVSRQLRIMGQSRNIGSTEITGQFGKIEQARIAGLSRNIGSTDIPGQLGDIGQPRYDPFGGNTRPTFGNEMNEGRNEKDFRSQNVVKFPKLELKRFRGDPMKWLEFWGKFPKKC